VAATSASWMSAPAAKTPVPWRRPGPIGISITTPSALDDTIRIRMAAMMLPPLSSIWRHHSSCQSSSKPEVRPFS
jgi:hypothetical protein